MIGCPLRCNPPVDLLSALFGVGGTPAFEILTAVPVTYRLALQKFVLCIIDAHSGTLDNKTPKNHESARAHLQ